MDKPNKCWKCGGRIYVPSPEERLGPLTPPDACIGCNDWTDENRARNFRRRGEYVKFRATIKAEGYGKE